ncbi:hypothetical protein CYMTET_17219 [Cymbomonas tetramitiformis]|uniref:Reverse transcriptase domain-containing protein n=1 Tax=Cymbomonas tetramitiformis TaxID=36881 RepID=A0AAE0GAY3_9CHLO|nr:hypothetical protein CYMTET_17219 [Cymbomonas tetramitiformis]
MAATGSAAWDPWNTTDVKQILESLRDLPLGANVTRKDWECAQCEILGGITALAVPLSSVPEEAVVQTRALAEAGLVLEGAAAGAVFSFVGAAAWDLPQGGWSVVRPEAEKGIKLGAWGRRLVLGEDRRLSWSGPKARARCKTLAEWERGFCTVLRKVKSNRQHRLMVYFKDWFHHKVTAYGTTPMVKFYEFFTLRMEEDPTVTFGVATYSELFTEYTREQGLRPIQPRKPGEAQACARGVQAVELELEEEQEEDVMSVACVMEFVPEEPDVAREEKGDRAGPPEETGPLEECCWEHLTEGYELMEAPRPVSEEDPEKWSLTENGCWRVRKSMRWPGIRQRLAARATRERLEATGTAEHERARNVQELRAVGATVPLLTERAHLMASALEDWHDRDFLVHGAACGIGWPSRQVETDGPFRVPNYVGKEHEGAMEHEIEKELSERHIFRAEDRLPWGVSALGMVEKVRNGKVKYKPVWDYSRPVTDGINVGINLDKDKFSSVKDAYALLRPGLWMVKMQGQGVLCVGYLDDFFMVPGNKEEAEERMMLLVEFVSFLGFKVNSAKCEGPALVMQFLGVLLSTEGPRRKLESLWGLLAFCSQVVYGLTLYTRRGFSLLAAADALKTKGMGGVLDSKFFLMSWEDLKRRPGKPWFPFRPGVPESEHINYLELFMVWWAVVLSGQHIGRRMIVVNIDNQCALRQVAKWWGPPEYLPSLKELFKVCVNFDIRLRPRYITTKDNKLADLLSRLRLQEFHLEYRAFMRASVWRQGMEDWMLDPAEWCSLDRELGPITVDVCVASSRANAFCAVSWSREEDARVQRFDGHQAWGSLPFSIMCDILVNFLRCKKRQQLGTAGTFLGTAGTFLVAGLGHTLVHSACIEGGRQVDTVVLGVVEEQRRYEEEALARGSYSTGVKAFVTFCIVFACLGCLDPLLPATDDTLGVRRYWDRPSKLVMPLTLQNLRDMAKHVDFSSLPDLSLWTAILVGFFGLFRKDNLTAGKEEAFNSRVALVRDDVLFMEDGNTVWIRGRYSKSIQCGERFHWVPLRAVLGSLLCVVTCVQKLLMLTTDRAGDSSLFVTEKVVGRKVQVIPLTHTGLVAGIKRLAEAVRLRPEAYAGHSLWRGGATAAKKLEVLGMYIKAQGDWKSDCFERYCELDPDQRLILPGAMAEAAVALG